MITLIGHGYVGKYIANELDRQQVPYYWKNHDEVLPDRAKFIINAAGFTGVPNVDACEKNKDDTMNGNVLFPLFLEYVSKVPVIHISSGCVYSGYPEGGFKTYGSADELEADICKNYKELLQLFKSKAPVAVDLEESNGAYEIVMKSVSCGL